MESEKSFVKALQTEYSHHSDAVIAQGMSAYLRNQFKCLGIQKPLREEIRRQYLQSFRTLDERQWSRVIRQLWDSPYRELQYAAMEFCRTRKKEFNPEHLALFEYMICKDSWWDTVDFIASNLVGELFRRHPELIKSAVEKWSGSGNLWLQRTCILFQLKYAAKTDRKLLFDLCARFVHEKDFFMRKAIGWALRQYSKYNPEAVRSFVSHTPLSPLSRREASKYI